MPHNLDDIDIAILKALQEDGRKSFRQISREIKISTPTVKFRYERLVNIGLIKAVVPIIDTTKLEAKQTSELECEHCETKIPEVALEKDMEVKMDCDYCDGTVGNKPVVLKFANLERFFCCNTCKDAYKEKYRGRIDSLTEKFQEQSKNKVLKAIVPVASLSAVAAGVCVNHGIQHMFHYASNLV